MPKIASTITDWTPPWADGEFDEDKARGLIYNLMKKEETLRAEKASLASENATLVDKVGELEARTAGKPADESAKDAEISTLTAKVRKLEKDGRPEDQRVIQQLEVALEINETNGAGGLGLRDARRLQGASRDELAEDATYLVGRLSGSSEKQEEPAGGQPPGRQPVPKRNGSGKDEAPVISFEEALKTPSAATGFGQILPVRIG